MPKLIHATLEPNHHNPDGCVVTLYFDGEPTEAQVRKICDEKLPNATLNGMSLGLETDTEDEFFSFEEHPTPVSKRAGLKRYQVYP